MISHDEALDLVADALDFELDRPDTVNMNEHLDSCHGCRIFAEVMKRDDDFLETRVAWEDEEGGDGEDDDEDLDFSEFQSEQDPVLDLDPPPPDPAAPGDDSGDPDSTPQSSESDDDDDPNDDASDDDDDHSVDSRPAEDDDEDADDDADDDDDPGDDEPRAGGLADDDEDDDDDEDEDDEDSTSAARPDPRDDEDGEEDDDEDDAASGESVADDEDDDEEDDSEAEEQVAAMSDAQLGDLEAQVASVYPDCVADAVEQTARDNGARGTASEAERQVRAADGLEDTDLGKVAICKSVRGITRNSTDVEASTSAAAAIRNAILRSRKGHTGETRYEKHGRLDNMGLHRIAMHDHRLFTRRTAPDVGKYLVWVMVDCSGSMEGRPIRDAASVARALADATTGTPSVRLAVWGWSDPFITEQRGMAMAGVAKVWETGQPTSDISRLTGLNKGGTPDATAMAWAWRAIRKACRTDEQPVIVMCSDGQGDGRLASVVESAGKHGVIVKSVALGYQVTSAKQERDYGRGNYVAWAGSIAATARPLATMIGRMAAGE